MPVLFAAGALIEPRLILAGNRANASWFVVNASYAILI